jgi:hypothetical protein
MENFKNAVNFLLSQFYLGSENSEGWYNVDQNFRIKVDWSNIQIRVEKNFSKIISYLNGENLRCSELDAQFLYSHDDDIGGRVQFQSETISHIPNNTTDYDVILRATYLCSCVIFLKNRLNIAYNNSQTNRM